MKNSDVIRSIIELKKRGAFVELSTIKHKAYTGANEYIITVETDIFNWDYNTRDNFNTLIESMPSKNYFLSVFRSNPDYNENSVVIVLHSGHI